MSADPRAAHQKDLFDPQKTTEDGRPVPKVQVLSFGAGQDSTALLEMWLGEEDFRKRWPAEHVNDPRITPTVVGVRIRELLAELVLTSLSHAEKAIDYVTGKC